MSDVSVQPGRRFDGSGAGALWVAGLGAFLLVVAAATFVAVRWDEIPDGAKLGALVTLTGLCVVAHRALRRSFPLTATAIFHLGVLLVPIDVAAVGVRAGWSWETMLLAQGLSATVVFGLAAFVEDSVVLRWTTWGAVVALAGGVSGSTDAPAPLLLAIVALAASEIERPRAELAAVGWAVLAGLAVPLASAERLDFPAEGVLTDLGLTGAQPALPALLAGVIAGVTLGRLGARKASVPLALTGIASVVSGATTAWLTVRPAESTEPPDTTTTVAALATVALLAELAAWIWSPDEFWARPTRIVAALGEMVMLPVTAGLAGVLLTVPFESDPSLVGALSAGLVTLTWLAAMARRPAPRIVEARVGVSIRGSTSQVMLWLFGPVTAAGSASAAVALASGSGVATAIALELTAAIVLLASPVLRNPRTTSGLLAIGLLAWASVAAHEIAGLAAGLGAAGALIVAATVVTLTRTFPARWIVAPAVAGSRLALLPAAVGTVVLAATAEEQATAVVVAVGGAAVVAWLVAAVLDLAALDWPGDTGQPAPMLSLPARLGALVPLLAVGLLTYEQAAAVALLVAALALLDAVRLHEPLLLVGSGFAVPVAITALARANELSFAEAGIAVTVTGITWLGLGAVLPARWTPPALISAVLAGAAGLGLSTDEPAALSTNLLIVGGTALGVGLLIRHQATAFAGAVTTIVGYWGHLGLADVEPSEAYLGPIAALLLAGGIVLRREMDISSWAAYAGPAALLGGAALIERLARGPAWHALLAGAVGVAAVAAGGAWRLVGPLLTGTALVVAVSINETLGVTSQLHTWVWLALAGALLLGAGLAMERRDLGPIETGRRLLDTIQREFS